MKVEITVVEERHVEIEMEAEDDMNALMELQQRYRDGGIDLGAGSGAYVTATASTESCGRKVSVKLGEWWA